MAQQSNKTKTGRSGQHVVAKKRSSPAEESGMMQPVDRTARRREQVTMSEKKWLAFLQEAFIDSGLSMVEFMELVHKHTPEGEKPIVRGTVYSVLMHLTQENPRMNTIESMAAALGYEVTFKKRK